MLKHHFFFFCLVSYLAHLGVFGQEAGVNFFSKKLNIDTNFIEDFSDKLVIRGFTKSKSNSLTIRNTATQQELKYQPNPAMSLGGGFNLNWLGLDLAFALPESEEDTDKYGETKSFDFQTNMYLRKFFIDASYVRYKGYFIEEMDQKLEIDTIIKKPEIRTRNFGLSLNYLFNNKKFSYRAAYLQNERQKKSAGSFFIGPYFSYTNIDSKKGFVPPHYAPIYPEVVDITHSKSWQLGAQSGYAHTFVIQKFYMTLAFGFGLGYENRRSISRFDKLASLEHGVTPKIQTRGAIGYNGNKLSFGLQGVLDALFLGGTGKNEVSYSYGSYRFFIAHRFNAEKPRKFLERINPFKAIFGRKK